MASDRKATIVYLVPVDFDENIPHILCSRYHIDAAAKDDFNVLYISNSTDLVYQREGQHIARDVFAFDIAKDLVQNYISSNIAVGQTAKPGIFCLDGEYSKEQIKEKFAKELTVAKTEQIKWFNALVRQADGIWVKTRQPNAVSGLSVIAARYLGLKKEWMIEISENNLRDCPACGENLPNPNVTKCAKCQTVIDPIRHAKLFGDGEEKKQEVAVTK